jgi:hypothetical protein
MPAERASSYHAGQRVTWNRKAARKLLRTKAKVLVYLDQIDVALIEYEGVYTTKQEFVAGKNLAAA